MSFIAASGDMAQRADVASPRASLKSRVISAIVLAPIVIGAVFAGGLSFLLLIALTTALMAWEWQRLCTSGQFGIAGVLFAATVVASVALCSLGFTSEALILVAICAIALGIWAARSPDNTGLWIGSGVVAVGLTGIALIWVRQDANGLLITFWFLLAVWATDIAAFFTGRAIGGPKLAPSISPGKTWSGLIGGVIAAALWSVGWALWTDAGQPGTLAALGAAAAICAQLGDLSISAVKRRFGAKDASQLIPGHGGLLDRVDGVIGAVPIAVLLVVAI